jgi:MFS family permease
VSQPKKTPDQSEYRWFSSQLRTVALISVFAGFGQFGAVAALGDVARTFGHLSHGATFADEVGLSGTMLGVGLAVLRLASAFGLPLASLADRFGRRRVLVEAGMVGLSLTALSALAPSYWWFVCIFALGRPFLSATSGVTQVMAVELTGVKDRAKAMAVVTAGYAVGAGATAVIHSMAHTTLGFRGIFALALVPLVGLYFLRHRVVEPFAYSRLSQSEHGKAVLGPIAKPFRKRLIVICLIAFCVAVISGPANSLVYIYAQNYLHVSGALTSAMVVSAGVIGLGGLLLGRYLADVIGRRPTIALSICIVIGGACVTYAGSSTTLFLGYIAGVTGGAVFAPAGGAFANELFPTSVRASVSGWYIAAGVAGAVVGLVSFGAVADAGGGTNHAGVAAIVVFVPMVLSTLLLLLLPETRGVDPDAVLHH